MLLYSLSLLSFYGGSSFTQIPWECCLGELNVQNTKMYWNRKSRNLHPEMLPSYLTLQFWLLGKTIKITLSHYFCWSCPFSVVYQLGQKSEVCINKVLMLWSTLVMCAAFILKGWFRKLVWLIVTWESFQFTPKPLASVFWLLRCWRHSLC